MLTAFRCLMLVALLAVMAPAAEPETKAEAQNPDDFSGCVLLVLEKSNPEKYTALQEAGVKFLGGKPFLVGKGLGRHRFLAAKASRSGCRWTTWARSSPSTAKTR